ncbi:DNA polymerase [Ruminococcus sp. YRD2003]|uniref:DNA polymerase n=1 Tax=Ruminococcus sp. YRD2003 TaxID=1452313 RepID=UPI0008C1AF8F|nr:DNA polymerase [Ruminococcus flavefaciens]
MQVITIDIETASDENIKECGVYRYAESEFFDLLLVSYSIDGGAVATCDIANGDTLPNEILSALTDKSIIKKAFNVMFERVCLSVYLRRNYPDLLDFEDAVGNYLDPESWQCDMIHSRYLGMMSSLDDMGKLLRLKEKKLSEGKDLIKFFCTLHQDKQGNLLFHDKSDAPKKWKEFIEYNRRDVEVELKIQRLLSEVPVPDFIWEEFYIDQRINDRGILVDTQFAEKAVELDNNVKTELFPKLKELTGIDNPNSPSQMKEWLLRKGIEAESLDKKAVPKILETASEDVKEVLTLYQQLSKSSVSKYHTMLNASCEDGRARGMFSFYGANRTGRFAGRLIQLQNLPQNHLDNLAEVKGLIKSGDFDTVKEAYDYIPDVLSQLIRTAFIPPDGKKFIVADFSAIEARVLSWLADEKWRMEAFANGEDIYCASASKMFGVPVEKNGVNSHLRQKGKIAELACGYGGSIGAIKAMGGTELKLTDDELYSLVNDWRASSPNIVKFWNDVQSVAVKVITDQSSITFGRLKFSYEIGILFIELPSGRRLAYVRPKVEKDENGKTLITYEGVGDNKKWARLRTYGAKLVENITQGVARDILLHSMAAMKDMDIVGHVHDEVIVECTNDTSVEQVCCLMEKTPEWAEELLLRADGYECEFYMKQ